jgi:hypothetical protein
LLQQSLEQPFDHPEGPFQAWIGSTLLVVQIAEIVPEVLGERRLGKLDGIRQDTCFVNQIQPIIPVILAVATYTVIHEQNRSLGVVGNTTDPPPRKDW